MKKVSKPSVIYVIWSPKEGRLLFDFCKSRMLAVPMAKWLERRYSQVYGKRVRVMKFKRVGERTGKEPSGEVDLKMTKKGKIPDKIYLLWSHVSGNVTSRQEAYRSELMSRVSLCLWGTKLDRILVFKRVKWVS